MTDFSSPGLMPISAVTGDPVARVPIEATVVDVARAMVNCDVGALVIGGDARPAALVSERDIVRAVAAGRDPATTLASSVASTNLVWCDAEASVDQVGARMMERYIRHVLVERDGALAGIVSARDLLGVYSVGAPDDEDFGSA